MKKIGRRLLVIIWILLGTAGFLRAQNNLTPEENALKEKLVRIVLNFDPVVWEAVRTELWSSPFPVYSLTHQPIQEAQFRFEFESELNDSAQEEQLQAHANLMRSFIEQAGKQRLQQDYQRLVHILRTYRPGVPYSDKLVFRLDENRKVTAIAYAGKYKKKKLPEKTEKALLSLLQKQGYQAFETQERIMHPNKKDRRFSLKRKWRRFKRLFERKPDYPFYEYKGRYYRRYE